MENNRELHYCKWCNTDFKISFDCELTGGYWIVCPTPDCKHSHYRFFKTGTAVNCDIDSSKGRLIGTIEGELLNG